MQVGTGQRINVTMFDYSYSAAVLLRHSDAPSPGGSHAAAPPPRPTQARTCRVLATIREPSRGATTTTVCDRRGRAAHVFTSDADRIELRLMTVSRPAHAAPAPAPAGAVTARRRPPATASRHDDTGEEDDNYVLFHYTGQLRPLFSHWEAGFKTVR